MKKWFYYLSPFIRKTLEINRVSQGMEPFAYQKETNSRI